MKRIKILGQLQKNTACDFIKSLPEDKKYVVEIKEENRKRTSPQNAKMRCMLREIAKQVEWYGKLLREDDWKDIFTAALKKQRVIPGLEGEYVVLGARTSEMDVDQISNMIELMYAFGAQHGVVFNDPTQPMEG